LQIGCYRSLRSFTTFAGVVYSSFMSLPVEQRKHK